MLSQTSNSICAQQVLVIVVIENCQVLETLPVIANSCLIPTEIEAKFLLISDTCDQASKVFSHFVTQRHMLDCNGRDMS